MINYGGEDFLEIPGHPGYLASKNGKILSLRRNKKNPYPMLRRQFDRRGYRAVNLCIDGKATKHCVHRLVAAAWLGPPHPQNLLINHKNGLKWDNRAENLEWFSPRENLLHAKQILGVNRDGERSHNAKLKDCDVLQAKRLHATGEYSFSKLGLKFGVDRKAISNAIQGKTWKHLR